MSMHLESEPAPAVAGRAGGRAWVGLVVLALPCVVYAMDLTVLNLAVPALSADLAPSSVQLLWIVDIYGFLVAGLLITMGAVGDRIGRRRILLIGAAAFAIASVVAACSTSAAWLIAARALLGVAGATLAPSTLALIRTMFDDPGQRTLAIGVWITSFSVGAAVGPLVGGALLESFGWGSVFLPAVPVMALLLVLGPIVLPEYRSPGAGRIDLASAVLALLAVLAIIYGLKKATQDGLGATATVVVGLGLAAWFLRRQRRLPDPLIDLALFRSPRFSVALLVYTLGFFVNFGSLLFIAQYLQLVLGQPPFAAGAWTVPAAAGFIVGSMLTPRLLRVIQPGPLVATGLLWAAVGCAVLVQVGPVTGLGPLVAGSVLVSLGLAAVFTVATDLVVSAAPPERAGAASAISETGSELGGALGIAVLGALGAAVYRTGMVRPIPGLDVPPAAADTLGAATTVARGLIDPAGGELLEAARVAFVAGFHLAAALSGAVLLVAAGFALRYLRGPGTPAPTDRHDPTTHQLDLTREETTR